MRRVGQGVCGCKGTGDKTGETAKAGRETVKAGGALCGAGNSYIIFVK